MVSAHPLAIWLISYLGVPVVVMLSLHYKDALGNLHARRRFIHIGLLASIIVSFVLGARASQGFSALSLVMLFFAALVAVHLSRKKGLFYVFSSYVQELALLLVASALLVRFDTFVVVVLMAIPFAAFHISHRPVDKEMFIITFAWGVLSVVLYVLIGSVVLNAALHCLFGSVTKHRNWI